VNSIHKEYYEKGSGFWQGFKFLSENPRSQNPSNYWRILKSKTIF
jgi:hypothetical protein